MTSIRFWAGAAVAAGLAVICACGSKSGGTGPTPSLTCSTLPDTRTILVVNNAACPQTLTVPRGSQVTFINNDSRAHEMNSDPHPEHTNCPELNQVGHLEPGQSRQTGNLTIARTCGFHDHGQPDNANLQGNIIVH